MALVLSKVDPAEVRSGVHQHRCEMSSRDPVWGDRAWGDSLGSTEGGRRLCQPCL